MIKLNNDWQYIDKWNDSFFDDDSYDEIVRIPHSVAILPLHNIEPNAYQKIVGYKKKITFDKDKGSRFFIRFEGVAHIAEVYFNGMKLGDHKSGYTAFEFELTDFIKYGEENVIVVKVDSRETNNVPPFGFVVDYLTYGGIYRDVCLVEKPKAFVEDVFIKTPGLNEIEMDLTFNGYNDLDTYEVSIFDNNEVLIRKEFSIKEKSIKIGLENIKAWNIDRPYLYKCVIKFGDDIYEEDFGFRTIKITENEFILNGEPIFIRGLNRHQNFPYIGDAAPASLQIEDARILKEELKCNAVRTSHYPQSKAFIKACDKLGLMVFTEIPGWQHIGNEEWKQQVLVNTEEMVKQYRNHPSIVIWGVRINESVDDDELYLKTNEIAHTLDPTRPTGGVRYLTKSNLLEDIYTFNDFSHSGINKGALNKKEVMKDTQHPLLISECNGHMFPTKSFDTSLRLQEHALRHARVLNDAILDKQHIGVFQWCMFDYPTHKDFGSGDRVCYHGVMDSFRNPKLAASVYAMQEDEDVVLEVSTSMDIGDYNSGDIGDFYVFTNADEVKLYKNNQYVSTFDKTEFTGLNHGPIKIDDTIGHLLEENEGYSKSKADEIRKCLLATKKYGTNLPLKYKLRFAKAMFKYKLSYSDGVSLYGKYVSGWGSDSTVYRFDALKNGEVVKSVTKSPSTNLHLEIKVSNTILYEGDSYDMAAVRIRLLDEFNNVARYNQSPISFRVEGPMEVVGNKLAVLEGGMSGTFVKTVGETGEATLYISMNDKEEKVKFLIKEGKNNE